MKLELRSRRINGKGELEGTVAILDDGGGLIWEDMVNLSRARQRETLVAEVADRAHISRDRARQAVLKLLEEQRAAYLREAGQEEPRRPRKADKLVTALLETGAELFHDQYGEPYVALPEEARRTIYRVRSSASRDRLSQLGYAALGEVPSTETVRAALNVIAGKAMFDGAQYSLSVRTAWHDGAFWYDLGDWRAVKVMPHGWEVVERPPILFRHYPHQRPQVEPVAGGSLKAILDLLTIRGAHAQLLFLTDLVAGLVPNIPRPLSIFHGPHGSTKTTALRLKRELADPVEVPVQGPPRDLGEFVQLASHNLCVFLDNLSSLPEWLSDGLSRFCTGDGFAKRMLYTTDEDFFYRPQGVGGLTGINLVVSAPDLLDRSFIYSLERLAEGDYLPESVLRERFQAIRPELVGAMFDTLSSAMSIHPKLTARRLPRLADYALWGCAVALALGYGEDDYWAAYKANIGAQTREALDASPVAQAVLALMQGRDEWRGSPSDLLDELNRVSEDLKLDTKAKAWPKDPSWVTRRLTLVLPNLAQVGITIEKGSSGQQRWVALKGTKNAVTGVSPVSGQLGAADGIDTIFATPQGKTRRRNPCVCPREEWGPPLPDARCDECGTPTICPDCGGCRRCAMLEAGEDPDVETTL